jgi:hypothetical protein
MFATVRSVPQSNPLTANVASTFDDDLASELLIAQLLEQDIQELASGKAAENLQLGQLLGDDVKPPIVKEKIVQPSHMGTEDDVSVALGLYASDARISSDAAYAATVHAQNSAGILADQQFAQRVAATEKKFALDIEFARRLQQLEDDGDPAANGGDVERVLGDRVIQGIMNETYSDVRKGKRKVDMYDPDEPVPLPNTARQNKVSLSVKKEEGISDSLDQSLHNPSCGICLEPIKLTHSPIKASVSANSSSKLPFGLSLPCPHAHSYCGDCLSSYIRSKLDPNGNGEGTFERIVFPVACPECPLTEWAVGIEEHVAVRVLSEKVMHIWHQQKIYDSLPKLYCPNPKCSQFVQAHEDADQPQAQCPSCQHLMCVPCRSPWHAGLDCEQYQALPLDERSPEDRATLQLARTNKWRRCHQCQAIVELAQGCNHITCRCGAHFCFKCGSKWTIGRGVNRCSREPPCELWDENMLLAEEERRNNPVQPVQDFAPPHHVINIGAPLVQPPPPPYQPLGYGYMAPVHHHHHAHDELDWLEDDDVMRGRHWFTNDMLNTLTCGYCDRRVNSRAALRHHLANVRHHPVFACCGRFFKREIDYERHAESEASRFGYHMYSYVRN